MIGEIVLLAVATVMVLGGTAWIHVRDLGHEPRPLSRAFAEAVLPSLGAAVLVLWAWSAL